MAYETRATAYATEAQFADHGLPSEATTDMATGAINGALKAASSEIDTYLRKRYGVPLETWDDKIVQVCCVLAAWHLLTVRGFNPDDPADESLKERYDTAMMWLKDVSMGLAEIDDVATDATQSTNEGGPLVATTSQRWT